MAIKREDLLKFSKSVELAVTLIEDDSSGGENGNEVKILHLANDVTAVSSLPTSEGKEMKLKGNKVYVGSDNIDEFLKDCVEQDNVLIYKGPMHLDVSKPGGRMVNGVFQVTKAAKIWLTKTKFSRFGGSSRQDQQKGLSNMINTMFSGGVVELTAATAMVATTPVKAEPAVVPNLQD